jgi:dolichol-phosphate mannosyltransferase
MDADMQNVPSDIPRLTAKLDEGFDVVSGWRANRRDRFLRTKLSQIANALISRISGVPLHDYGCSLKAYRKDALDGVKLYGETHRFVPIFAKMNGGSIAELPVDHRERTRGKSKYGFERIVKVILDLLLVKFLAGYSAKPGYVFGGFGIACLAFSLIPTGLAVFYRLMPREWGPTYHKDFVETPLPVISAVLVLVGVLSIFQGLLAELLARTYFESQGKRTYLVRRINRSKEPSRSIGSTGPAD